jgi:hypothetical protein
VNRLSKVLTLTPSFACSAKLSGQNFRLEANSLSGSAGQLPSWLATQKPMVIGADLSHEPDRPSVAVLTATMHDQNMICAEAASVQGLIEPGQDAPPRARAKKQETIKDAHNLFLVSVAQRHAILPALLLTWYVLYRLFSRPGSRRGGANSLRSRF